eukprot:TRINITY_DN16114_c0_g1_i3.p1 TRINITY_DN16114_c0_g1~~TRINITY_DN16114_c0_g1_i3.p1  ORF type:complete len:428 (-),score=40.01 TRINITY_DN16114_c0_g1_i3:223-1506(-)
MMRRTAGIKRPAGQHDPRAATPPGKRVRTVAIHLPDAGPVQGIDAELVARAILSPSKDASLQSPFVTSYLRLSSSLAFGFINTASLVSITLACKACAQIGYSKETWRGRLLDLQRGWQPWGDDAFGRLCEAKPRFQDVSGVVLPTFKQRYLSVEKVRMLADLAPRAKIVSWPQSQNLPKAVLLELCSSFRSLAVLRFRSMPMSLTFKMLADHAPNLKIFDTHDAHPIHKTGLAQWSDLPRLKHLEVLNVPYGWQGCPNSRDKVLAPPTCSKCLDLLSRLPCLRRLDLSQVWSIGDKGLSIISQLPSLRHLVFHDMGPSVTFDGITSLAEMSSLELLDLRGNFMENPTDPQDPGWSGGSGAIYRKHKLPKLRLDDARNLFATNPAQVLLEMSGKSKTMCSTSIKDFFNSEWVVGDMNDTFQQVRCSYV